MRPRRGILETRCTRPLSRCLPPSSCNGRKSSDMLKCLILTVQLHTMYAKSSRRASRSCKNLETYPGCRVEPNINFRYISRASRRWILSSLNLLVVCLLSSSYEQTCGADYIPCLDSSTLALVYLLLSSLYGAIPRRFSETLS
jgi:hypothetical protein